MSTSTGALPPSRRYPHRVYFNTKTPGDLIDAGYDSIRIEKRKNNTASWVPITLPFKGMLDLQEGVYNYSYTDDRAEKGNEYRAILTNSDDPSDPEEIPQAPTKGVDITFEQILTIQELRDIYLWGQDPAFISDDGRTQPDYALAFEIDRAIARVENQLDQKLVRTKIVEKKHYNPSAQNRGYMLLKTNRGPLREVESITLTLPGSTPYTYAPEWITIDEETRQISIIPSGPNAAPVVLPQPWVAGRFIPFAITITYWAGFDPPVPADIRSVVGKEASLGPLNVGGDLVAGAGLAGTSLSVDGLSQSVTTTNSSTNAGFGARLLMYRNELKKEWEALHQRYRGIPMVSA